MNYPNQRPYNIALATKMLGYCRDFTHIKKITGLSIRSMVSLNLIEWYHPFKIKTPAPTIENPNAVKEEIDTRVKWLRTVVI